MLHDESDIISSTFTLKKKKKKKVSNGTFTFSRITGILAIIM